MADEEITFESVYNKNKRKVLAVAYKILKNKTLAEEACSDTFLKLLQGFRNISHLEEHQIDYYIFVTVRNISLNILKKEQRRIDIDDSSLEQNILITNDTEKNDDDLGDLSETVSKLSDKDKEILYLRAVSELDYNVIAKTLGISELSARKRFSRAKNNLAELLKKEGRYEI